MIILYYLAWVYLTFYVFLGLYCFFRIDSRASYIVYSYPEGSRERFFPEHSDVALWRQIKAAEAIALARQNRKRSPYDLS